MKYFLSTLLVIAALLAGCSDKMDSASGSPLHEKYRGALADLTFKKNGVLLTTIHNVPGMPPEEGKYSVNGDKVLIYGTKSGEPHTLIIQHDGSLRGEYADSVYRPL